MSVTAYLQAFQGLGRGPVEGGHHPDGRFLGFRGGQTGLQGGGDDAGAQGLGEHQQVPGAGSALGVDALRMHQPGDRQAVFHLRVLDTVPPHQQGPGFVHLVQPPPKHRLEGFRRLALQGKADDIHGQQRPAPHGVDVREGVGRGDGPELIGIVDDGGKEIYRLDQGQLRGQTIDPGVVRRLQSHQEIGMALKRQAL